MIKKLAFISLVLCFSLNSIAQTTDQLTAKEKHEQYVETITVKIIELDAEIVKKENQMASLGDGREKEALDAELKTLKSQRKGLKKSVSKVITVAMPIVGKNAMMGFFGGVAGTFVYNLDKNWESPYSITSAYVNKSLENSGILFGVTNKEYLAQDKWRFSEQYIHYEYEMPISVVGVGHLDMFGDIDMVLLKAWRRVGNTKWYAGIKAEYNKSSVRYGHDALANMNGSTTMYSPGIVLDYDSRDKKQFPTKGFYMNNNFTYMHHGLGFTSSNPESGEAYVDPVAYYFISKFQYFHSPSDSWKRTFSHGVNLTVKTGDLGSSQYVSNTGDQRSFTRATLQGPVVLSYNIEYDHFLNKSKFGFAVFGSLCNVSGNKGNSNMNGTAAGIGTGIRYMARPAAGIVLRADYGAGFTFKDGSDTQRQFSMGIGKFF